MKNKFGFALLATATMLLASCGETPASSSSKKSSKSKSAAEDTSVAAVELPKFNVVIKGADGAKISEEKIEVRKGITKPADPTAPAGKVFYGWKNNKNGGQIWDFEEEHKLNQVMADVELEPMFVPAGMNVQLIEPELCREIQEANGGTGIDGATYSGGAKGKQFVYKDRTKEDGTTTVSGFKYYEVYANQAAVAEDEIDEKIETWEDVSDAYKAQNPNFVKVEKEVKDITYGAMVHFNYYKGNVLSMDIVSSKAATNVTMFARFSAEYGKATSYDAYEDTIDAFNDQEFQVKVNGVAMEYGNISINNIQGTNGADFIYCQDYLMSTTLNLKEGANKIELVVNNEKTLNGTIAASAPCVDSIKLFSDSTITWPQAKYTNLL